MTGPALHHAPYHSAYIVDTLDRHIAAVRSVTGTAATFHSSWPVGKAVIERVLPMLELIPRADVAIPIIKGLIALAEQAYQDDVDH